MLIELTRGLRRTWAVREAPYLYNSILSNLTDFEKALTKRHRVDLGQAAYPRPTRRYHWSKREAPYTEKARRGKVGAEMGEWGSSGVAWGRKDSGEEGAQDGMRIRLGL